MIIKNICPHPKRLDELGKYLMPGEQCDLGEFSQKERDECYSLQEAFRKGEFICIGMSQQGLPDAKLRTSRLQVGVKRGEGPLMPVLGGREESGPASIDEIKSVGPEEFSHYERPKPPPPIDHSTSIVARNSEGIISVVPISTVPMLQRDKRIAQEKPVELEFPTITSERIREIMAQHCISFRSDGKKCKRWAMRGYEYCVAHMPKDLLKKYKEEKKQQFFHD